MERSKKVKKGQNLTSPESPLKVKKGQKTLKGLTVFDRDQVDQWKPTAELRWHCQEVMAGLTIYDEKKLQQKWTRGSKAEWRDVHSFVNPTMRVDRW